MTENTQKFVSADDLYTIAVSQPTEYSGVGTMRAYLDKQAGEPLFVYERPDDPDDDQTNRDRIAAEPDRYVEFPGLNNSEQHAILEEFLTCNWTDDEQKKQTARNVYYLTIRRCMIGLEDQEIAEAFEEFREQKLRLKAEGFLKEHGITPIWE